MGLTLVFSQLQGFLSDLWEKKKEERREGRWNKERKEGKKEGIKKKKEGGSKRSRRKEKEKDFFKIKI